MPIKHTECIVCKKPWDDFPIMSKHMHMPVNITADATYIIEVLFLSLEGIGGCSLTSKNLSNFFQKVFCLCF